MEMHLTRSSLDINEQSFPVNPCPKCNGTEFMYGWEYVTSVDLPDGKRTAHALHELSCNGCGNYMRVLGYSPLGQELLADKWNNQ